MLYRPHRGVLADSMAEVKTFSSKAELVEYLENDLRHWPDLDHLDVNSIHADYVCFDARVGWQTYNVILDGYGVLGQCNEPLD
jgi:hypothetical protein